MHGVHYIQTLVASAKKSFPKPTKNKHHGRNEEIVIQYIKLIKKWFYMTDISFKVPHNYSNIDLLAYDPIKRKYYDIEVKYRSAFTISLTNIKKDKEFSKFVNQFLRPERAKKTKEIIGEKRPTKIFVTTYRLFGRTKNKREQIETEFKKKILKKGYDCETWYFDEIMQKIFDSVEITGRHNTELIQTIRFIKTFISDKADSDK